MRVCVLAAMAIAVGMSSRCGVEDDGEAAAADDDTALPVASLRSAVENDMASVVCFGGASGGGNRRVSSVLSFQYKDGRTV